MVHLLYVYIKYDHCRIGSLEIVVNVLDVGLLDHCRIGSLEITKLINWPLVLDHCRIGSLESQVLWRIV